MIADTLSLSDTQVHESAPSPVHNGAPEPPPAPAHKVHILLVDDRPDKLLALEAVLSSLGQIIVKAHSGKEALRHLLHQDFAVILLDVSMPGMDGFETASLIRSRPRSEHTPIIFITSISASENHIAKGYTLGAVDYMLSPIVPDVLRAKVSVFVELHRQSEEIKTLNRELERRVAALTEINNELEAFTYSISHDLRAPLRSIGGFAQILREHAAASLDDEGLDCLRRMEGAAKYMDILLLDLLQYSRLNRCDVNLAPVNLDAALRDVLTSIDREIHERKAVLRVRSPLGLVVAHPATLRQVLFNLVSNALKFVAPDQVPQIEIWSEPRKPVVRVWVADSGIGIEPHHQTKIFGLFQRLHSQEAYPGTGVGLALVRRGLERMDGRIGLESQPGQGTRFWFELPAPPS